MLNKGVQTPVWVYSVVQLGPTEQKIFTKALVGAHGTPQLLFENRTFFYVCQCCIKVNMIVSITNCLFYFWITILSTGQHIWGQYAEAGTRNNYSIWRELQQYNYTIQYRLLKNIYTCCTAFIKILTSHTILFIPYYPGEFIKSIFFSWKFAWSKSI